MPWQRDCTWAPTLLLRPSQGFKPRARRAGPLRPLSRPPLTPQRGNRVPGGSLPCHLFLSLSLFPTPAPQVPVEQVKDPELGGIPWPSILALSCDFQICHHCCQLHSLQDTPPACLRGAWDSTCSRQLTTPPLVGAVAPQAGFSSCRCSHQSPRLWVLT